MVKRYKKSFLLLFAICFILSSCSYFDQSPEENKLIIFHAGSLAKPFHEIAEAFKAENPGVKILLEGAGSRECARKITELNKPCDIIATSDYAVIETLLIPEHASWQLAFAGNEMCIAFNDHSRMSREINENNWFDILLNDSVYFGRSDPESDPCGYRTVLMLQLAEKYYAVPGLADQILKKDRKFIRPKEVDLMALLEVKAIDYMINYSSVAKQHHLSYIALPVEINLSDPAYTAFYATASVELSGKTKADKIIQKGEPMVYGISILNNAPNRSLAVKFIQFLIQEDKGLKILEMNGQRTHVDISSEYDDKVPEEIMKIIRSKVERL